MASPADERPEPSYQAHSYDESTTRASQDGHSQERQHLPAYNVNHHHSKQGSEKLSDEEGTVVGEEAAFLGQEDKAHDAMPTHRPRSNSHLTVQTEYEPGDPLRNINSPSQTREQAKRLDDDLAMLQIERQVSRRAEEEELEQTDSKEGEMYRSRSRRRDDTVDEFDEATNPVYEKAAMYKPLASPTNRFGKFVKRVHTSNWLVRYIVYITPLTLILLIPLLLAIFVFPQAVVGGVYLLWIMIWLEIVWLTMWASRILAKCLPWPIGLFSSLFTNNSKKWRDMGKQLELPATLFFWWLAIEVSFLPTMLHHQKNYGSGHTAPWMKTMNKVLVSIFVGAICNFIEKIIIQLIAISFHLRTYADRIELNKFQIGSLTKLYSFSKEKIAMEDYEFELPSGGPGSGARTPGMLVNEAAKQTKEAFNKFGDIAGKLAGDFTGRQTAKSTHPHQVVLTLLNSTSGSQVLARRLYRTFAREETETVHSDDLKHAFDNDEEADAAFSMFDKDMNGDISMEELEAVCVEIGRERKSITASLKDLDSVIGKLDDVLMFVVALITFLVFISLISTSAAGVLTSAGSTILALSWLLSATAQEFLQSLVFVFVKHPFDVGDRVSVYGNTGSLGRGDDYFVKEISLLFTEFKKMEGHVVQAPNSYLNTLFILNQRRSGGLAEAVSISVKFGTTLDQIDGLRQRLLDFVKAEKREYQSNILTELRDIVDVHSMNINVVFFYKSNWQNEGLRLARRNKFICAMMVSMQELGIEGPYMRFAGQKQSFPMFLQQVPHVQVPGMGHSGQPDAPTGIQPHQEQPQQDPHFVTPQQETSSTFPTFTRNRMGSILKGTRGRGESLSAMNKRVDFSLGASGSASGDYAGDVYEDRSRTRVPIEITEPSRSRSRTSQDQHINDQDFARTTSRESPYVAGGLARRSTDSGSSRVQHRNRFFGRARFRNTGDEQGLMENGMADIPENPSLPQSGESSQPRSNERLDPRSGLVSPAAWRLHTDESNIRAPQIEPVGEGIRRSQTEDFEMRRFR